MYFVYIVRTSKGTLYTGQTKDISKRLKEHKTKKAPGSKYLRAFESFVLVYKEEVETLSDALKRETKIKKLTKTQKENLIKSVNI